MYTDTTVEKDTNTLSHCDRVPSFKFATSQFQTASNEVSKSVLLYDVLINWVNNVQNCLNDTKNQ